MLHSSLSSVGRVEGGAETVVEAFLDAMGPEGTLLTPAFTPGAWVEHLAMPDCRACCPQEFCPSVWPSHEGAIPNAALKRPGRLRSCHPTHSWVANGARAAEVLRDHRHAATPCGCGNPFEKLVELDGCIVTLGVGVNTITLWHYFEDILQALHGTPPSHGAASFLLHRRQTNSIRFSRHHAGSGPGVGHHALGKGWPERFGVDSGTRFRQFMAAIMADDPYCFIVRPPDRQSGDLAIDALQKAAAMLRAWAECSPHTPCADSDGTRSVPTTLTADGTRSVPATLSTIVWPPGNDDDLVREDCPAFAGYHEAAGKRWPLCRANGRHPELFRYGGVFNEHGKTTCGRCPWHLAQRSPG